jgi:transposase
VDTLGLLLAIVVTAASVQDRDGARPLLCRLRLGGRGILLVWADAAYAGRLVTWARSTLRLRLVIVRRRLAHAFEVLPRRWVIERTFAWLSRYRRTVRDYERLPAHHQAMVQWAMTIRMAAGPGDARLVRAAARGRSGCRRRPGTVPTSQRASWSARSGS